MNASDIPPCDVCDSIMVQSGDHLACLNCGNKVGIEPGTDELCKRRIESQLVTLNELETRLRQAKWDEKTLGLLFRYPSPKRVRCGGVMYIVKG